MKNQDIKYPRLGECVRRFSQQLHLTRDEIVRLSGISNNMVSAVWNGKDVRISYYAMVLKHLIGRTQRPYAKCSTDQLVKEWMEAFVADILDG